MKWKAESSGFGVCLQGQGRAQGSGLGVQDAFTAGLYKKNQTLAEDTGEDSWFQRQIFHSSRQTNAVPIATAKATVLPYVDPNNPMPYTLKLTPKPYTMKLTPKP